jgi:hypothetical protein
MHIRFEAWVAPKLAFGQLPGASLPELLLLVATKVAADSLSHHG